MWLIKFLLLPNLLSHCGQGNSPSSGRLGVPLPDLGVKGEVIPPFSPCTSVRQFTVRPGRVGSDSLSSQPAMLGGLLYPDSLLLSPTRSKVSVDMSAPLRNEAEPSILASKLLSG